MLIVDDEDIIRVELKRMIQWDKMGFYIKEEAINGYDAMQKLGSEHVDLLISDIKMPKVDGLELFKELKEKGQCSCAVFLSGYSEFDYVRPALVLGAFDYVLKPLDKDKVADLLKRVHKYLTEKYKEKEEKKALIKAIELNPALYPLEGEQQLLSLVIQGNNKASALVNDLIMDMHSRNCDLDSIRHIGALLISNVLKGIFGKYPHIKNFLDTEKLDKTTRIKGSNLEEVIMDSQKSISGIIDIITDFKLNQKDNIVIKACEYVLENIENDINLKDVSEHFFISRNYFCSLFKKETGENFLEYVTKAKIERAKILLKENNYKAYEVSSILGYKETAYFSKLFKKYTGHSPTEYRKYTVKE